MADKVTAQPKGSATVVRTVRYFHQPRDGEPGQPGQDAVMYELFSDNCAVRFNADGVPDVKTVSVLPRRIVGESRETIPVNTETGAEFWCLFTKTSSATSGARRQYTVVPESVVKTLRYGRFDLVPKGKAHPVALGTSEIIWDIWQYDPADVVASREVIISIDGEPGDPGEPGAKGATGALTPPPALWIDYPAGYQFQSGKNETDTRSDVVLHGQNTLGYYKRWRCVRNHDKPVSVADILAKTPGMDGGQYWEGESFFMPIVATNLLLADNAYIELLSSQFIRIYNSASEIVGQFSAVQASPQSSGIQLPFFVGGVMNTDGTFANRTGPLFAVDTNGRAYFGGTSGQRIEMDPLTKAMLVYDSDGKECASHSGKWLNVSDATSFAQSGDVKSVPHNTANSPLKGSVSASELRNSTVLMASGGSATSYQPVSGTGKVMVTIPPFLLKAKMGQWTDPGASSGGPAMQTIARAEVVIQVFVGASPSSLAKKTEVAAGYVFSSETGREEPLTTEARTLECIVESGQVWDVRLAYILSAKGTGGEASFAAQGPLTTQLTVPQMIARYGANGWFIASGNLNYAYMLFDESGVLKCKAVSDGRTLFSDSPVQG